VGTSSDQPGGAGSGWTRARSTAASWAGSGGGSSGPGVAAVVAEAVAALAGAAAGGAVSAAVPALARLGGLAADAGGPGGLPGALADRGLGDLLGKPPLEVHAALVDVIAGDPVTRDDHLARLAAEQAVAQLLDTADDLDALVVDETAAERLLETFIAEWLARLVLRELGTATVDPAPAAHEERSRDIRDYISSRMRHMLRDRRVRDLDWSGPYGQAVAAELLRGARDVFGDEATP
jgi:hypothetical protein